MLYKVTHCAGCILANTRPHQQCWVTGRLGLLCHTQNAVKWLASSKRSVEALPRHASKAFGEFSPLWSSRYTHAGTAVICLSKPVKLHGVHQVLGGDILNKAFL